MSDEHEQNDPSPVVAKYRASFVWCLKVSLSAESFHPTSLPLPIDALINLCPAPCEPARPGDKALGWYAGRTQFRLSASAHTHLS